MDDTSAEAVGRLINDMEMLARVSARFCDDSDVADEAVVMLRALLAERDRLRGALGKIAARVDRLTGGLTYTEKATRDIARAALGEERA